jgi:hypothetical protein
VIDVDFEIIEGKAARVNEINISGNTKTVREGDSPPAPVEPRRRFF